MPESLGKILKKIRESKQLSIEEVSERSRIPKNIISLIEEDKLGEIKSIFYAKSFVKTYANFLGALNESCVREFIAKDAPASKPQKKQEPVSKPIARQAEIPQIDFSAITKYKKQALAVIAAIIAFWALSFAIGHTAKFIKTVFEKRQNKIAVIKKETRKKAQKEKEKAKAVETVKDAKKEVSDAKPDSVELEVIASDNTWLKVIGDGELLFTGMFRKGASDTWKAKKEIKMEAGNSGAVKISVNGKPQNFSGKKGEKKEIVITKDGIK